MFIVSLSTNFLFHKGPEEEEEICFHDTTAVLRPRLRENRKTYFTDKDRGTYASEISLYRDKSPHFDSRERSLSMRARAELIQGLLPEAELYSKSVDEAAKNASAAASLASNSGIRKTSAEAKDYDLLFEESTGFYLPGPQSTEAAVVYSGYS